jgi:hypothetical protein
MLLPMPANARPDVFAMAESKTRPKLSMRHDLGSPPTKALGRALKPPHGKKPIDVYTHTHTDMYTHTDTHAHTCTSPPCLGAPDSLSRGPTCQKKNHIHGRPGQRRVFLTPTTRTTPSCLMSLAVHETPGPIWESYLPSMKCQAWSRTHWIEPFTPRNWHPPGVL